MSESQIPEMSKQPEAAAVTPVLSPVEQPIVANATPLRESPTHVVSSNGEAPQRAEVHSPLELAQSKRKKISDGLARVQGLSDSWKAHDGRTKTDFITALKEQMEKVKEEIEKLQEEQERTTSVSPKEEVKIVNRENLQQRSEADFLPYITIGTTKIPVCQPPRDRAQWEAVAGRLYVEGGRKWSDVFFEKRGVFGLPETIKPGDVITWGKRQGERLPTIDHILEGAGEMRGFNEVVDQLARLQTEYQELNPDAPDYDGRATALAAQVAKFASGEIKDVVDLEKLRIEDPDGFSQRVAEIVTTREFLRDVDVDGNGHIPPIDPNFKLTPYFEDKMSWFAQLVNRQIGLGNNRELERLAELGQEPEWEKLKAKGMTVIVGPRGTGKNKLADHYAAISQRPMFRYACSPDKTEYDLTYDVVLKDGEVVKIPSRIISAITTPNALLELDEVNLLHPAVSKFFNSLLDHDRAIFLNNEVINSAPGVAIVGLMNPADYEGVQNLPETIDDRSNAMYMGYPPLREKDPYTKNERFTHDEALILKANITPLADIPDNQFVQMWNQVINGERTSITLDPELVRVIQDLKNLVSIANKTRETVQAKKTRTGDVRMERDVSLRGSVEAARFYSENHLWSADLRGMPNYRAGWNAAAYAIAATYLPHTSTYKKGREDVQALETILAEQIRV